MEGSRTELRKWLIALFMVSRISCGISAWELSQIINVTYKTAWLMLHKIRFAMSEADVSVRLSGFVHVNDAIYGRRPHSTTCRLPQEHPILVGASSIDQDTPTYLKMKIVPKKHLDDKLILRTGTIEFAKLHVEHSPQDILFSIGPYKSVKFKKLYPFFSAAKRWINQTFHGLGSRHLNAYLNEFCYRLNLRFQNKEIFENLAQLCMESRRLSYAVLTS
jgi:hypothetical protein